MDKDRSSFLLSSLLNPRSIAIVGASQRGGRGTVPLDQLIRIGYEGRLYPVNPKYDEVRGLQCYPNVAALPEVPDCTILGIQAEAALPVLDELGAIGSRAAVLLSSGFAEAGAEGGEMQRRLRQTAFHHNIALCGPNCHGILNVQSKAALFSGTIPEPLILGGLAFVAQSGVMSGAIVDKVQRRGIGLSYLISTGNEAVLDLTDYIEFLLDDSATRVIATFIEGLRDARRFSAVADRAVAMGKPLIVVKVGRSQKAAAAAMSHTGSMVGDDQVIVAMLKQHGVIVVEDLDTLVETSEVLLSGRIPSGNRLAVLSTSGGGCGLIADLATDFKIDLPDPSKSTEEALVEILPAFAKAANPLDITGGVIDDPPLFERCVDLFLGEANFDSILYAHRPRSSMAPKERELVEILSKLAGKSSKPVGQFHFTTGTLDAETSEPLRRNGGFSIEGLRPAMLAMKALGQYGEFLRKSTLDISQSQVIGLGHDLIGPIRDSKGPLGEIESGKILKSYGIPIAESHMAFTSNDALDFAKRLGRSVALKVQVPGVTHRFRSGLVRLNVPPEGVPAEFEQLVASARQAFPQSPIDGVVTQEMISGGLELILGAKIDAQVGPVVMVGLGGVLTEVIEEMSIRVAPILRHDAYDMLTDVKSIYHFIETIDVDAVISCLMGLSNLVYELGDEISIVEINPLLVFGPGGGATAVDALIIPNDI